MAEVIGEAAHQPLRIFFLPLMSPGHMIPMVDMAKLFALRGPDHISITIVTTPGNEPSIRPSISSLPNIHLLLVPFPSSLPNDNLGSLPSADFPAFFRAFFALQSPIEALLLDRRPDCIISDYFFHCTADTAIRLNIPRLVFYGHGIFASCVHHSLHLHRQHETADSEPFVVRGLPHPIHLTRSEVSLGVLYGSPHMEESVAKSYGVVVNSFYELEPEYADLYRSGRRAYYVGPLSMSSTSSWQIMRLGPELTRWLDSMEEGSVVYACFGSLNEFSAEQLREIAAGLEQSDQPFLWAVRNLEGTGWMPEGFEERVRGRNGVVVRGWAPQVAILNHPAVGGFVTHCGWNSTLEGVTAGVPMVTWPVEYEQFVNEKLITQVLGIGVSVGPRGEAVGGGGSSGKNVVKAKQIAEAVKNVMSRDERAAEERRARVKRYAEMAKAAMEEGGSSYRDMSRLIQDIREHSLKSPSGKN